MNWEAFEREAIENGFELKVMDVPQSMQPTTESLKKMNDRLRPQIAQNELQQVIALLRERPLV